MRRVLIHPATRTVVLIVLSGTILWVLLYGVDVDAVGRVLESGSWALAAVALRSAAMAVRSAALPLAGEVSCEQRSAEAGLHGACGMRACLLAWTYLGSHGTRTGTRYPHRHSRKF